MTETFALKYRGLIDSDLHWAGDVWLGDIVVYWAGDVWLGDSVVYWAGDVWLGDSVVYWAWDVWLGNRLCWFASAGCHSATLHWGLPAVSLTTNQSHWLSFSFLKFVQLIQVKWVQVPSPIPMEEKSQDDPKPKSLLKFCTSLFDTPLRSDTSRNLSALVSAKSSSNISPKP